MLRRILLGLVHHVAILLSVLLLGGIAFWVG